MSNVMNPDGTHKLIAGYSHAAGLQERDQRIAELEAENKRQRDALQEIAESSHLGNQWAQRKAEAALEGSSDE